VRPNLSQIFFQKVTVLPKNAAKCGAEWSDQQEFIAAAVLHCVAGQCTSALLIHGVIAIHYLMMIANY
jgi:hypothetical protein